MKTIKQIYCEKVSGIMCDMWNFRILAFSNFAPLGIYSLTKTRGCKIVLCIPTYGNCQEYIPKLIKITLSQWALEFWEMKEWRYMQIYLDNHFSSSFSSFAADLFALLLFEHSVASGAILERELTQTFAYLAWLLFDCLRRRIAQEFQKLAESTHHKD